MWGEKWMCDAWSIWYTYIVISRDRPKERKKWEKSERERIRDKRDDAFQKSYQPVLWSINSCFSSNCSSSSKLLLKIAEGGGVVHELSTPPLTSTKIQNSHSLIFHTLRLSPPFLPNPKLQSSQLQNVPGSVHVNMLVNPLLKWRRFGWLSPLNLSDFQWLLTISQVVEVLSATHLHILSKISASTPTKSRISTQNKNF